MTHCYRFVFVTFMTWHWILSREIDAEGQFNIMHPEYNMYTWCRPRWDESDVPKCSHILPFFLSGSQAIPRQIHVVSLYPGLAKCNLMKVYDDQSGLIAQSGTIAWLGNIFACSGNMSLCNCVEFDNQTLNLSVGAKLSKVGCFLFAHHHLQYFKIFDWAKKIRYWPGGKNIDLVARFLNNTWIQCNNWIFFCSKNANNF